MKTTGECLSAETIEAGGKTHTAFVFIKPHANNEKAPEPENRDAWGCVGCWVINTCCAMLVMMSSPPLHGKRVSQVQTLVKEKLTAEGLTVKSEGQIKSNVIDAGLDLGEY